MIFTIFHYFIWITSGIEFCAQLQLSKISFPTTTDNLPLSNKLKISQLVGICQNTWHEQCKGREHLFKLRIPKVSLSVCLVWVLWIWGKLNCYWGKCTEAMQLTSYGQEEKRKGQEGKGHTLQKHRHTDVVPATSALLILLPHTLNPISRLTPWQCQSSHNQTKAHWLLSLPPGEQTQHHNHLIVTLHIWQVAITKRPHYFLLIWNLNKIYYLFHYSYLKHMISCFHF